MERGRSFAVWTLAAIAAGVVATLGSGCTTLVPPRVQVLSPLDPGTGPFVYLTASDERDRVARSLERAGLTVTDDIRVASTLLEVRLGDGRARRSCGAVRNVSYVLRQRGSPIVVIKARGRTGSCEPNVLDATSEELARLMAAPGPGAAAPPSDWSEAPPTGHP